MTAVSQVRLGNALDLHGYPISPAMVACGLVHTSGVLPMDPVTGDLVPGAIDAQTRAVLENLDHLLHAAGSSLAQVLSVTVYLADIEADFGDFDAVYREYFSAPYPARCTIGVRLALPGLRIELQAVAAVDSP